jgi:hypothetical protein
VAHAAADRLPYRDEFTDNRSANVDATGTSQDLPQAFFDFALYRIAIQ